MQMLIIDHLESSKIIINVICCIYAYKIYCQNIQWLNNTEVYLTCLLVLKITQLQDKFIIQLGFIKNIFFRINNNTLYNV